MAIILTDKSAGGSLTGWRIFIPAARFLLWSHGPPFHLSRVQLHRQQAVTLLAFFVLLCFLLQR